MANQETPHKIYPTIAIVLLMLLIGCNKPETKPGAEPAFSFRVQPRDNRYSLSKYDNDATYLFRLFYFLKNTSNQTQYFSLNPSIDGADVFLTNDNRIVFDDQIERLAKLWNLSQEDCRRRVEEGIEEKTMNVALPPGITFPGELNIKIIGRSTGTIRTNLIFAPWIYVDADTSSFITNGFEPKRPENARRKQLGHYQSNDFKIKVIP